MEGSISIALSGGGVRAMVYHLGVLKYFAEQNAFERISNISSVSGGSLLIGLIYKENNYEWPSSKDFITKIYPSIRRMLISVDIQKKLFQFIIYRPWNWNYLFSNRAKALSKVINSVWGVSESLSKIPHAPEWSINGTTIENGKRFRFKNNTLGDYDTGYAEANNFSLSEALAVSAGFPAGIGPLTIKTNSYKWKKKPTWNGPDGSEVEIAPDFKKLHLYDGGVYDNLGTEPLFNSGTNLPKNGNANIFVSDAGKPLFKTKASFNLNPNRLARINDVIMDQSRSLRVRSFMSYLTANEGAGGYSMIGQHPKNFVIESEYNRFNWLSKEEVEFCSKYSTNLKAISLSDFDLISRHGYESTRGINIVRGFLQK